MRNANLSSSTPNDLARLFLQNGFARIHLLAALGLILGALAACTSNEPPSARPVEVQDRQKTAELPEHKEMPENEKPGQPDLGAYPVPQDIMQKLVTFVATEAGVSAQEVILERAEKSQFADGSLGCPQPNMGYNQVIVEGYWVVFHVGQEEFDMRATDRGGFSRCQGSTKRAPIRYDDT